MHETPIGHRAHQEEGEEEVIDHFPFSPLHLSHFLQGDTSGGEPGLG